MTHKKSKYEKSTQSAEADYKLVINPMFFLVIFVYVLSRIIQWFVDSENFWSRSWNKIIDVIGEDYFHMYVTWTTIFSFAIYWIFGGIFTLMDMTLSPKALRKYKVQPKTNEPVDRAALIDAVKLILFNQIAVGIPLTIAAYHIKKMRGFTENFREVPSFQTVLIHLVVCILFDDMGFYYSHRLLHYKFLYKYIHKKHHLWQSPIAITATYCHPLEHLVGNLLPVAGGAMIMQSHISVLWLWLTLATLTTLIAHCGYHLPFFHSSEFHDFHHLKFVECYGKTGLFDWFHSTDTLFRKTVNGKRHRVLFSLKTARERFPDDVKKVS